MSNSSIIRLVILGAIAVLGIVFIQGFYVIKSWDIQDDEFDTAVRIALRRSAQSLADFNGSNLPKKNLIQRRSSNTYAVNINDEIDPTVLEDFLIRNFENFSLNTDFEYALYDCSSDELVYGNYCDIGVKNDNFVEQPNMTLPKFSGLEYYFVVRFPSHASHLMANLRQSIWYSVIALLSIVFFIYAIIIILKQRRLSQMQKDFINNMTHEFKTPIASIKLAANSVLKNKSVKGNEKLKKYIEIIDEQSNRLEGQVEKILTIAQLDKSGFEMVLEPIYLNVILNDVVEDLDVRIRTLGGGIYFQEYAQVNVIADKTHLTNIIYSLLDNAIKYRDGKPIIDIELHASKLVIRDNGLGIAKENLRNIFKKFYRVPTGNIHNVKGFGLGLFYVKNIIHTLGWEISVDSDLGKGTEFSIFFNEHDVNVAESSNKSEKIEI